MQNQVFCRFCGKVMPADSQFCPHCGKSQGVPVAAAPSRDMPPEQGIPASVSVSGDKKGSRLPMIILAVVAGVFVLCCVGLLLSQVLMRDKFGGTLPEIVATSATSAAMQTDLSEKWSPAFLILYAAEQHYAETITKFERLQAGTLTREMYTDQFAIPDAYEVIFIGYFRAEEADIAMMSEETALDFVVTRPLVASLEDDFENIVFIEMDWMIEKIDEAEALSRLREGQRVLTAERDKMYQAAKTDGMTDEVYATIQSYLEEQWPTIKAKLDALGIKMMTPEP